MSNSSTAYAIRAGEVREIAVPADGLRIRLHGERPGDELVAQAGGMQPHWDRHTLAVVRDIATRLTPWATWWVAPRFERAGFGGEAHRYRDLVAIIGNMEMRYSVFIAYHEAWHIAEPRLDPEEFDAVHGALASGHDWGDDYYGSPVERRANLFADWAMAAFETGRPLVDKARPETLVFQFVHSGALGLRLARRGNIPASRMSASLRAAAAMPERSPRKEIPLALGGLAAAGAAAWMVPWAAVAPYLAAAAVLGVTLWAMSPDRKRGDAA